MTRCPDPATWRDLDARSADARRELLTHAAACRACRARMLAEDPSRAFALLALRPIPPAALERVSASVAATLDAPPVTSHRRRAVAAGWAAAAILAVALAGMLASPMRLPRPDDIALADSPLGVPRAPRAGVEVLSSPGAARVVDLAVGETQVVMIFDERLDL